MSSRSSAPDRTGCCVVGGGPGGMFLALLLARQGVDVTLLEMHHDFDRDFRGDTIHPSTLELLHHLGLARALHALPHGKLHQFTLHTPDRVWTMADFASLPVRYPYIMLMPQARFLAFLAEHAKRYPNLRIVLGARVNDLLREDGVVRGVRYDIDGTEHTLQATLTVASDGRFSKLRKLAGLEPIRTAPPMDVAWFRLPRLASDPTDQGITVGAGRFCVLLDRGEEWQLGFVIPKGGYQQLRTAGLPALHRELLALLPWLGDRVATLTDWHQLTLLSVESSRLPRWYVPGRLLCIGDAAHVMSPVGGVGINYAIQDAVVAANLLADPINAGTVTVNQLAAVQRKREWAVRFIQKFQSFLQSRLIAPGLDRGKAFSLPLPVRFLIGLPILRQIPARIVGLGFGREMPKRARPGL